MQKHHLTLVMEHFLAGVSMAQGDSRMNHLEDEEVHMPMKVKIHFMV